MSGWGLPLFFLRGSSDSRLVSLVRDFFGKILTGGIVDYCTVFLDAVLSVAVYSGALIIFSSSF